MKPIANQKRITIYKEKVSRDTGKERPYFLAYIDTLEKAAQELKGNAFKVYIYLLTNLDGFHFGLSPQDISNKYGMSLDSARDAIKQLIDKGYLELLEDCKFEYAFYDRTDKKPINLPDDVAKKLETKCFTSRSTGEVVEYTFKQILEMVDNDFEYAKSIWEGVEQ